ncbi:hypothetical protein BDW59DRAFT_169871 [Aspergillus cavernicola]|uniref:Peptidase M20 dimerisation domain-containing protein n=1 Tax=Aspergillus cavernicola TaxID=176166 RepID=A0ABR4ITR5_9EURO
MSKFKQRTDQPRLIIKFRADQTYYFEFHPQQILGTPPKVQDDNLSPSLQYLQDETLFLHQQVTRLSKAVQGTTITDSMIFPLIHSKAKIESINRLGLIITLDPSPETRRNGKPLLLSLHSHQDVVPINDASDWTHPSTFLQSRPRISLGKRSRDCKNGLIVLLSVVEDLLDQDWKPSRPVERYGKDGVEFILDEGSLDVVLSLSVPGGHSSVPPQHTGIGIIHFVPSQGPNHPSRQMLQYQVRYSPEYVEDWLPSALTSNNHAAAAEDIAQSRGKVVRTGAERIIKPIVEKYNLAWSRFSQANQDESEVDAPLNPVPVSPTDTETSPVWARFAGATRSVIESVPSLQGKTVIVSGDIMTGNTDTRFYWNVLRNIYRWSPARESRALNIHTVDERIGMDANLEAMVLYYDLIRAFGQWDGAGEQV